jgi:hypothetical protein
VRELQKYGAPGYLGKTGSSSGVWLRDLLSQIRKTLIANSEPVCEHQTTNGYNTHGSFCRRPHYSRDLAMPLNQMAQRRSQSAWGGQPVWLEEIGLNSIYFCLFVKLQVIILHDRCSAL